MYTRAVAQSPTLCDVNLRCAWTSIICLHKQCLCPENVSPRLIFCHRNSIFHRLSSLLEGIGNYAVTVIMTCAQNSVVHLDFDYIPVEATAVAQITEPCLIFQHMYSMSSRLCPLEMGFANMCCLVCYNATEILSQLFSHTFKVQLNGSNGCLFCRNLWACLSYYHAAIQYVFNRFQSLMRLQNLECSINPHKTHDIWLEFSGAPESGWIVPCLYFCPQNA